MNFILPYLSVFFEIQLFNSLSILDLGILVMIVFSIFNGHKISISKSTIIFILFLLWTLICFYFLYKNSYFEISSYYNNLIRAAVYLLGFILIPQYLKTNFRIKKALQQIVFIIIFLSILGVIEFVVKKIQPNFDLRLTSLFGNYLEDPNKVRIKTLFSEPAHYGIYLSLLVSILLFYKQKINVKLKYIDLSIIISFIALLVTTSFISIIFMMINMIWYFNISSSKVVKKKWQSLIIILPIVLFVLYSLLNFVPVFKSTVLDRIGLVLDEDDGSGNQRIYGQFEIFENVAQKNLITGVGWGQTKMFIMKMNTQFQVFYNDGESSGINNSIVSIFIQTGIVGLILYLLFFINVLKKSSYSIVIFFILLFSWGFAMSPILWFFLYLLQTIRYNGKTKKKNIYEKNIIFKRKPSTY